MQLAADRAAGGEVEAKVAAIVEPLVPRGWLARLPEPERVTVALDKLTKLIGVPGSSTRRPAGAGERAIGAAAVEIAGGSGLDLHAAVPGLVDDPHLRLAGAEEMIRQFHATTERLVESNMLAAEEQEAKAKTAYDYLSQYTHFQKGTRKPTANEFSEALSATRRCSTRHSCRGAWAACTTPCGRFSPNSSPRSRRRDNDSKSPTRRTRRSGRTPRPNGRSRAGS